MLFRGTQLIHIMQLRCNMSQVSMAICCEHRASLTKSNRNSSCPRQALKGCKYFSDSQEHTKMCLQSCRGVTMNSYQTRRLWSHWCTMRFFLLSFCLLPLKFFYQYQRGHTPQIPWFSSDHAGCTADSLLKHAVPELRFFGPDTSPESYGFLL